MNQKVVYPALFVFGGAAYGLIEIAARGYTHWTMLLTGGVCSMLLYALHRRLRARHLWQRAAAGAAAVTAVELAVGLVVNRWLGLSVWDYSSQPFNLLGQVCPAYTLCWFALCLVAMSLFSAADHLSRRPS